jgi:uncharacterized glyoxalase superfamily protein PhnB
MLTVKDAASAIVFYREAFGATEKSRVAAPSGHVVAELEIDGHHWLIGKPLDG